MRTLRSTLWIVPLLALGCRSNPNQVLLERESRMLEDQIFHLEAMLDDCQATRESLTRENESLKKELAHGGDQDNDHGGSRSAAPEVRKPSGKFIPPSIELPSGSEKPPRRSRHKDTPQFEAPIIEMPEPSDTPPGENTPGDDGATVIEGQPTQLVINPQLTSGLDRDNKSGDEGILVMVEPRDADGHLVRAAGTLSIVVMDPALEGDASRVARWDFASREVSSHFHNTVFGRGLQFELPWPGDPPVNRELRLFVRFTTEDGKKITSDIPLEIRMSSDPPREDRQTKSWSSTESARRPPRDRNPRPKTQRPLDNHSGQPARSTTDAPDTASDRLDERPVRQAATADRPTWKPYR